MNKLLAVFSVVVIILILSIATAYYKSKRALGDFQSYYKLYSVNVSKVSSTYCWRFSYVAEENSTF